MAKRRRDIDEDEFDFLRPDKDRLDEEWVNQPRLYYKYAVQLADARLELDDARAEVSVIKADYDEVKAEVDLKVRAKPERFGIPSNVNITENLVKQLVIKHKRCKAAQEKVREVERVVVKASHKVSMLHAAVGALDHRKAALERLVNLHGQSYFATPRASDEDSRGFADDAAKKSARVSKKKSRH